MAKWEAGAELPEANRSVSLVCSEQVILSQTTLAGGRGGGGHVTPEIVL